MKTKRKVFNIMTFLLLVMAQAVLAQKFEKKQSETFKVSKNVVVAINTSYTDVVIETWNKNTVSIEAKLTVEGEGVTEADAKEYFKNWHFEALANKTKVSVTTNDNPFYGYNFRFPHVVVPELSVKNLDILDSFKVPMPVINDFAFEMLKDFKMDSLDFNFEKYRTDTSYLKDWQARVKIHKERIQRQMEKDSVFQKQRVAELKKNMEKVKKEMLKYKEQLKQIREKDLIEMKNEIARVNKDRALKIKSILEKRDKIKLKKTIYIKVPKGAVFKPNVRFGSISLPTS